MLDPVREFALEQIAGTSDEADARKRHAAYFLELAQRQWDGIDAPTGGSWWTALEEGDNLRAALEWYVDGAEADAASQLVCWLTWFWERTDRLGEGRRWCERALALDGETEPKSRAQVLYAAGSLSWLLNDIARAGAFLDQSIGLFTELGETLWLARALDSRADTHIVAGELEAARTAFEASLELFGDLARPGGVAAALHGLGQVHRDLGERDAARSLLDSAADIYRRNGDRVTLAATLHSMGDLELDDAHFATAGKRYGDSLAIAHEIRMGQRTIAYCLAGLAAVAAARGDSATARRFWDAVERLEGEMGVRLHQVERVRYERLVATVIDTSAPHHAESAGPDLSVEEAVAYARSLEPDSAAALASRQV
jgi:tetratricopeptide (TPR) repeat protein